MHRFYHPIFEKWAPVIGRILFGAIFLHSAYYKIPGTESFAMQVDTSGQAGIPFPLVAVFLAFVLEVVASLALIVGVYVRLAALSLIVFVALIAVFFVRDLSDMMQMITFFSCLQIIAGLLYVATYGAQHAALKKDPMPVV